MKKTNIALFLFISLLSYAQKKETIVIKKQGELFFYRTGTYKDSTITKNSADTFLVKMSDDRKESIEIKLLNATFLKTTDEHLYKLIYTPGMRYRMVYATSVVEGKILASGKENKKTFEVNISTDGANTSGKKDIVIEVWDTQTNKLLISNSFVYNEK